jgi:Ca2+-binding RTX toxin-like protein
MPVMASTNYWSVKMAVIRGGRSSVLLSGSDFDDRILGLGGNDNINANDGNDVVYSGSGSDAVDLGAGNDFGRGGFGRDVFSGGAGNDVIFGEQGNDKLYGEDGGWIPSRSATVSSKPDLNVFSKLGKHGLDGCFEGEAFSRG